MKAVLVDTCIWSLALRGKSPRNASIAKELTALIHAEKATIIGPIRQELLSGYSNFEQFNKLKNKLIYFPNEPIIDEDYETAAEFSNRCRNKGIQGSHIDFLICAVAHRLKLSIYTRDKDCSFYSRIIPVLLYSES